MATKLTLSDHALCTGRLKHVRHEPVVHAFEYPISLLYLNLDKLDSVFSKRWLWSLNRPNVVSLRRKDHLYSMSGDFREAVTDALLEGGRPAPTGPIMLLAQPAYFGYAINPIALFLCLNATGDAVESVIAQVTNTPWDEQRLYVLEAKPDQDGRIIIEFDKALHVSPFLPMNMDYRMIIEQQDQTMNLVISTRMLDAEDDQPEQNQAKVKRMHTAALRTQRTELNGRSMAMSLLRYPWMTAQIAFGIYWQALRLKLKGVEYIPPPEPASTTNLLGTSHRNNPASNNQALDATATKIAS